MTPPRASRPWTSKWHDALQQLQQANVASPKRTAVPTTTAPAAVQAPLPDPWHDDPGAFRLPHADDIYHAVAPGVNLHLLRSLQQGKRPPQHALDLHHHTLEAAHAALIGFVAQMRQQGVRCVRVITGWGQRSPGGSSVLRQNLPTWLTRPPLQAQVLAFCPARPADGGAGAFYVLLRRSPRPPR